MKANQIMMHTDVQAFCSLTEESNQRKVKDVISRYNYSMKQYCVCALIMQTSLNTKKNPKYHSALV